MTPERLEKDCVRSPLLPPPRREGSRVGVARQGQTGKLQSLRQYRTCGSTPPDPALPGHPPHQGEGDETSPLLVILAQAGMTLWPQALQHPAHKQATRFTYSSPSSSTRVAIIRHPHRQRARQSFPTPAHLKRSDIAWVLGSSPSMTIGGMGLSGAYDSLQIARAAVGLPRAFSARNDDRAAPARPEPLWISYQSSCHPLKRE